MATIYIFPKMTEAAFLHMAFELEEAGYTTFTKVKIKGRQIIRCAQ